MSIYLKSTEKICYPTIEKHLDVGISYFKDHVQSKFDDAIKVLAEQTKGLSWEETELMCEKRMKELAHDVRGAMNEKR